MSARPLSALPVRAVSDEDAAQGRVAAVQAQAAGRDGPVVNGVVPGSHHAGPCAFLVGVDALAFAYGDGRIHLSSAAGWLPLIGRRFGRAVINSDEPEHAVERRQWGPLFSAGALDRALPVIDALVLRAAGAWCAAGTVDAYAEARTLSFAVMAQALAGIADARSVARLAQAFAVVLDGPSPGETPEDCVRRLLPVREALERDLVLAVAALRAAGPDATGLVPLLLRAAPDLDDAALARHLGVLMVAGHETTGSLLARMLLALCDQPAWQARLAAEARTVMPQAGRNIKALEALPLAEAFIAEVARLHPSLVNAPRIAAATFEYAGICIPAGHAVALALGATQRLPASFAAPERFDPERFLHAGTSLRTPPILTFATGTRYCLGARFAMLEARLLLVRLLQHARLERAAQGTTVDAGFWNTRPRGALHIRVLPRVPSASAA